MSEQDAPRLAPLPEAQWTGEMREMFAPTVKTFGRVFNIFTTLGRHPKLLKRWMVFANHCLLKSSLPPRERELVILRAGWLCKSEYEWAQHNRIGLDAGLSANDKTSSKCVTGVMVISSVTVSGTSEMSLAFSTGNNT